MILCRGSSLANIEFERINHSGIDIDQETTIVGIMDRDD